MNNQDEMCASNSTDQCLLDNLNPSDPAAWTNGNSCNQGSISSFYIPVHEIEDITTAFNFSRETGVRLSIKNSGHDYLGRSSLKGSLALWMRNWGGISRDLSFIPEGCGVSGIEGMDTITTGPGVNFDEVYQFAEEEGVTFIGAYAGTVGVSGGWVQGGGHSVLSPVYGLGIDRVVQLKIVTTDGVLRVANACQNQDLFWALRGGGGGTFGVVVEATHRVEKKMSLLVAEIKYVPTKANVREWLEILVNNSLRWGSEGWGGHYLANNLISVTPLLDLKTAQASMDQVSTFALENNGTVVVEELDSWYAFYRKYVTVNEAAVGGPHILASRIVPASLFRTEEGMKKLLRFLYHILDVGLSPYIPVTAPYLYDWDPASTSATPAWRDSLWTLGFAANWKWNSTVAERRTVIDLLHNLTAKSEELTPGGGAYHNEANPWTKDWKQAWWGNNYERLLEIKKKYDPEGLLGCWKCVGFEEESANRDFPCFARLRVGDAI